MDFNGYSMKAHFNDLERQVKPQPIEHNPNKTKPFQVAGLVSIVGVLVAAGLFFPVA